MNHYLIAERWGGLMECPDFNFVNPQIIRAESAQDAVTAYNSSYNCNYFYGAVMISKEADEVKVHYPDHVSISQLENFKRLARD